MISAFIFPGQGSQSVGMGKKLADAYPDAKAVFDAVDDALEQKLSSLMFEGPEDKLMLTENAQPAIMAVSVAVIRVLELQGGLNIADAASYVAGHSLGEYSAHAAAGTFSLADTARLLKKRGQAMQQAVPVGEGAMAALLGLGPDDAEVVAAEAAGDQVCDFANDNADGQVVVSGSAAAVKRAVDIAREKGAKRAMLLPVSAPFHCSLMMPAARVMAEALDDVAMKDPVVPIVANVTAAPVQDVMEIRRLLVEQVTCRVRWRESVMAMKYAGVGRLVEIGHGKVLTGMTRRIDREISGVSVGSPKDIDVFLCG